MTFTPPGVLQTPVAESAPSEPSLPSVNVDAPWEGLNVGCGPHRAEGWLNVDVVSDASLDPPILPDMLGNLTDGLDVPSGRFSRVYLGHVLEHIPWPNVHEALLEARRVLAPEGEVVVVGPDVFRAISQYKADATEFSIVEACLEDARGMGVELGWEGARHQWNCHERRVKEALTAAGFDNVAAVDLQGLIDEGWPLVSAVGWQLGIRAKVEIPF